ncbi:MAG: hypothetical protein RSC67_01605 [Carnobacterium sp.]|uniref:hypothetical protein n=1 Tax=Carnobacterium sp. TaxID=48221 RepID=UPI002FCBB551
MSELYKAMKRIEDYQSTKPLYKQIAEIKGIASTARYGYDIQPQLTIPQSIADELDGYFKYKNPFEAILRDYSVRSNDVIEELRDYLDFLHSNLELCITYLAGKALGVDLVKVVEG